MKTTSNADDRLLIAKGVAKILDLHRCLSDVAAPDPRATKTRPFVTKAP